MGIAELLTSFLTFEFPNVYVDGPLMWGCHGFGRPCLGGHCLLVLRILGQEMALRLWGVLAHLVLLLETLAANKPVRSFEILNLF